MKASTAISTEAISLYNNALVFSNRGEYDHALTEYRKAIALCPGFVEAYNNIGEIYSRMGDTSQAITTYQTALAIERNYKVLLNIGVEYYNKRDYRGALAFFTESLAKKPDFIEGNFYAGMAHFNMAAYEKAEQFFSRVVQFDRKHLKANYLLSYIYYEWKDYGRTLECLDHIRDTADDRVFLNRYYGFCYYHLGRYDDAVAHLTDALEACPQYARFKGYLKKLTYENKRKEMGDIDAKIREMEERMMRDAPTLSEYTRLSMLYIFQGEYKKAEDLLLAAKGTRGQYPQ
ncbi:MAG TPA: tetratricopeptide repeat protein [Spirochaetota bacterium]|nr:tetratricopeptide repeat protein [Spirochaetota bacterium]